MNRSDPYQIIQRPVQSEKAYEGQENGVYVFSVDPHANKQDIKWAICKVYNLELKSVKSVNTANYRGKRVRRGMVRGRRNDWKKAVVRLAEGITIDSV